MEVKDVVTLVSAVIIVIGWFVNSYFNRKHEIFKKNLDYRVDMYQTYLEFAKVLIQADNVWDIKFKNEVIREKIQEAQLKILLYGEVEEIKLINKIVDSIKENNNDEIIINSANLSNLMREKLRKSLRLPEL